MLEGDARRLLVLYPQIYLACHTKHVRAQSSEHAISMNDANILGHLDLRKPQSPLRLAKHMGVNASTMSAALERLEELGYLERKRRRDDRRRVDVRLTERGAHVMQQSSVLDFDRVTAVLTRLDAGERRRAIEGMAILARACVEATLEASEQRSEKRAQPKTRKEKRR